MQVSALTRKMVVQWLVLSVFGWLSANCRAGEGSQTMELGKLLAAVRNDGIVLVTVRPPGSPFTTIERRVVVTGPESLVALCESGNLQVLADLVDLLHDPDRAWGAEVLLAAMTGREEKQVDAFAAYPDQWWDALGKTSHQRWNAWLQETRGRLRWDPSQRLFVEAAAE